MLSPEALRLIEAVRSCGLLNRVGDPLETRRVLRADSWRDALKRSLSTRWYNIRLEQDNVLTEQLSASHRPAYRRWNDIANTCRPMFDPIVEAAVDRLDERLGVRKLARQEFFISVRVDLMGMVHEIEYTKLVKGEFYRSLLTWYLEGHLPCDWQGAYPKGRLVVY